MSRNQNEKNICMIVFNHFESDSRVKREARSLISKGYNVYCISLRENNEKKKIVFENIEVIKVMKWIDKIPKGSYLRYFLSCTWFLFVSFFQLMILSGKGTKFKVIHIHNPPDHLTFLAIPFKVFNKTKIILDRHEPFALQVISKLEMKKKNKLYELLTLYEKVSYSFVDAIIVINELEKEDVRKLVSNKYIIEIRNSFDNKGLDKEIIKKSAHKNEFIVLYQGFISKRRDIDTIIESAEFLKDTIPNLKIYFVGSGDYVQNAYELIKKKNIQHLFTFEGWLSHKKLFKIIAKSDICLLTLKDIPVYHRATPNKLFEYMFFNKIIIAADLPTIRSSSEGIINYYLPENPRDLADKIKTIWLNLVKYQEEANNISHVLEKHLWNIDEKQLIKLYKELLK